MKTQGLAALIFVPLATGCGDHGSGEHGEGHQNLPPAPALIRPEAWSGSLSTAIFADENPDPTIVEVTLVARVGEVEYLPGKPAQVWTYNGSVPGPTLVAKVGDRVIVHFRNELPEPTTIHWHGVRVPNGMDGSQAVQQPIPPGGAFDYDFTLLDAGTFWYHPHVRSDVQVEKGLYGAILVTDPSEPALPVVAEEVVVLDDIYLNPDTGQPEDVTNARTMMMGREGNLVLVNGQRSNLELNVTPGEARRWHIVNAANSRYFLLTLASGQMTRIGGDGGLIESPASVSEVLLTPGERIDVVAWTETPGSVAVLRARPYPRAVGAGASEEVDIIRLATCADCPAGTAPTLPGSLRPFSPASAPTATRTIRLDERMQGERVEFTINGSAFPDVPRIDSTLGSVEAWDIVNESEMDHPFHLHGFFFQPDGAREWKDTINIPSQTTVRLLVDFRARDGAAGSWMYHCHILEHAEGGMMAEVATH